MYVGNADMVDDIYSWQYRYSEGWKEKKRYYEKRTSLDLVPFETTRMM